jgi:hypothetical protein
VLEADSSDRIKQAHRPLGYGVDQDRANLSFHRAAVLGRARNLAFTSGSRLRILIAVTAIASDGNASKQQYAAVHLVALGTDGFPRSSALTADSGRRDDAMVSR